MRISKENCIVILPSLLAFNNRTISLIQDNFSTVIFVNSVGNKKSFRTLDTRKLIYHDITIFRYLIFHMNGNKMLVKISPPINDHKSLILL